MAIALEFIDLIVPVACIRQKYPGGWAQCLKDHQHLIGGRVWHDGHLFRDGAMNPHDIQSLVDKWQSLGFQPIAERDGLRFWRDLCVVEYLYGGPTMPCDWIMVARDGRSAHLKGTNPDRIFTRLDYAS